MTCSVLYHVISEFKFLPGQLQVGQFSLSRFFYNFSSLSYGISLILVLALLSCINYTWATTSWQASTVSFQFWSIVFYVRINMPLRAISAQQWRRTTSWQTSAVFSISGVILPASCTSQGKSAEKWQTSCAKLRISGVTFTQPFTKVCSKFFLVLYLSKQFSSVNAH